MGIKIDDDPFGEESRRTRAKRWDAYSQYLNDLERSEEARGDDNLKTDASSRRQATEMDARPQVLQQLPAAAPPATDAVQRAPGAKDWMSGIRRVGAAQETTRVRDPDLNAPSAEAERTSKRVHEQLTDVFGDEAETMERIDAQVIGFVEKKTLPGGRDQALRMQQLLEVRSSVVARAEGEAAADSSVAAKLSTYQQWSRSLVGRAEAKIRFALEKP